MSAGTINSNQAESDIKASAKALRSYPEFCSIEASEDVLSFVVIPSDDVGQRHYTIITSLEYPAYTVVTCSRQPSDSEIYHDTVPVVIKRIAKVDLNLHVDIPSNQRSVASKNSAKIKMKNCAAAAKQNEQKSDEKSRCSDTQAKENTEHSNSDREQNSPIFDTNQPSNDDTDETSCSDSSCNDADYSADDDDVQDDVEDDEYDYYNEDFLCCPNEEVETMHPLLSKHIEQLKYFYGESSFTTRVFEQIGDIDIELHVSVEFLDEVFAQAWKVIRTEPIIIRLHLSLSRYLNATVPKVEVFQPSNKERFGFGTQLQKVMETFISSQWKLISNENCSRSCSTSENCDFKVESENQDKSLTKIQSGATKQSSKLVGEKSSSAVSLPSKSLSTKEDEVKKIPSLENGWLAQVMCYAYQRVPTLNEYCIVCDERHICASGAMMLKSAVCGRELCVFAFQTLGVMSDVVEDIATSAEVIDLLVAMAKAACFSVRKELIFDPYPTVVNPKNAVELAFDPKNKDFGKVLTSLHNIPDTGELVAINADELKKKLDQKDVFAYPLLQWIINSNRSHIVRLPEEKQMSFMNTNYQFLLLSSPPAKEAAFTAAKETHGSTFAFHGSKIENWHSIMRLGLVSASGTKLQLHGAAYGKGVYLSPLSSVSLGYSGMNSAATMNFFHQKVKAPTDLNAKSTSASRAPARFLTHGGKIPDRLKCVALCEVITSKDLKKHNSVWVCANPEHVCTRFFFVYDCNARDVVPNVDTQKKEFSREILRAVKYTL